MAEKNNPSSSTTDRELLITRVFDAPRSLVFKAWTEPERIKQWWGPRGAVTLSCEMDFRPGGLWRTRSKASDGREYVSRSVFREIVEPERLVFTYAWEDAEGKPKHETLVTITFVEQNRKTVLTFQQGVFESVTSRDAHEEGWREFFDLLSEYLPQA
jgi:uncharacterized protein YndB with AHSA1/START domain